MIEPFLTVSCTWTGPHCVWATEPVTVVVEEPELLPEFVPELVPGLVAEPDPVSEDPLPDVVPDALPEMVVAGVLVDPRCEASKPKSSTMAETVLSTQ